jgi:hypothetical protein
LTIDVRTDFTAYIYAVARTLNDAAGRETVNSGEGRKAQAFDGVMDGLLREYCAIRKAGGPALANDAAIQRVFDAREALRPQGAARGLPFQTAFDISFDFLLSNASAQMQLGVLVFFIDAHLARLRADGIELPADADIEFPGHRRYIVDGQRLSPSEFERMIAGRLPPLKGKARRTLLATCNRIEIEAAIARGEAVYLYGDPGSVAALVKEYGRRGDVRAYDDRKAKSLDTLRVSFYMEGPSVEGRPFSLKDGGMIIAQRLAPEPYSDARLLEMYPGYRLVHHSFGYPVYEPGVYRGIKFLAVEIYVLQDEDVPAAVDAAPAPDADEQTVEVVAAAEPAPAEPERKMLPDLAITVGDIRFEFEEVDGRIVPAMPVGEFMAHITAGAFGYDDFVLIAGKTAATPEIEEISVEGVTAASTDGGGSGKKRFGREVAKRMRAERIAANMHVNFNRANLRWGALQLYPQGERRDAAITLLSAAIRLYDLMMTFMADMFTFEDEERLYEFTKALESAAVVIAVGKDRSHHMRTMAEGIDAVQAYLTEHHAGAIGGVDFDAIRAAIRPR